MAEWKVSGSESEGDGAEESTVGFRGFEIPPSRIVELLQSVERRRTLKLDCLSATRRKERRKAKRRMRNKVHSPGTVKNLEEVSETASEVRSTTSTTDCRDARRPSLSRFDYSHEDFPALTGQPTTRSKKPPDHRKEKKVASLDNIVAGLKRQKRKDKEGFGRNEQQETVVAETPMLLGPAEMGRQSPHQTPLLPLASHQHTAVATPDGSLCGCWGNGPDSGSPMEVDRPENINSKLLKLNFDEDSESPTSEMDMKLPLLSQIDRVEKLLDAEGLT